MDKVWQLRILWFGLSIALWVFSKLMAMVLMVVHREDICLTCYPCNWLILGDFRKQVSGEGQNHQACNSLGLVVNHAESKVTPTQVQEQVSDFGVSSRPRLAICP